MWYYKSQPFNTENFIDTDYIGFVYCVTDNENGMKYIGKKNFYSKIRKPPLKGKTRKRTLIRESDWRVYCGSSAEVKSLVEQHGLSRFYREIIHLCKSKGEMSYLEMKEQITRDVLLKPNEYYNSFVGGKIHRSHLKRLHITEALDK